LRDYELMWLLPGSTTEAEGEESIERMKSLVTDRGGEVKSAALWARRTLSYPIQQNREGAYYLAKFSVDASAAPEINAAVEADQTVLRHILIKDEPKKPEAKKAAKAAS
jgi:small subunit ribosomal protein S6